MSKITTSTQWKQLEEKAAREDSSKIKELFSRDPNRAEKFSIENGKLFLDYSKNPIDAETFQYLVSLAKTSHLEEQKLALFSGKKLNVTEDRPALHTALRHPDQLGSLPTPPLREEMLRERQKMSTFVEKFRDGLLLGVTKKSLTSVIHIGIGGSDLGPSLVTNALAGKQKIKISFVSNVDVTELNQALKTHDLESTLIIIASKTFSTSETLINARTVIREMNSKLGKSEKDILNDHVVATTANIGRARDLGISESKIFAFWDSIGGRYSIWSSVGLPIALAIGFDRFCNFLAGAHQMDKHFIEAPAEVNMPTILALVGIWNINFLRRVTHAVLPYSDKLKLLPDYLQQLEMESNGKQINKAGQRLDFPTAPVIFGGRGTNFQHSFAQHLHQSPVITPCDFIGIAKDQQAPNEYQDCLLSNCFAQSEALLLGSDCDSSNPTQSVGAHKSFDGDRPSNTILIDEFDEKTLGALIALYEHKVFCQSVIWNINPFDQWGVELGKNIEGAIRPILAGGPGSATQNGSTRLLIERVKKLRS